MRFLWIMCFVVMCCSLKSACGLSHEQKDSILGPQWKSINRDFHDPNFFRDLQRQIIAQLKKEVVSFKEAYRHISSQFCAVLSNERRGCSWLSLDNLAEVARRVFPEDEQLQLLSVMYMMIGYMQKKATHSQEVLSIFNAEELPIGKDGCRNAQELVSAGFINLDLLDVGKKCQFIQRQPSFLEHICAALQGYYLIPYHLDLVASGAAGDHVFDVTIKHYGKRFARLEHFLVLMENRFPHVAGTFINVLLQGVEQKWGQHGVVDIIQVFLLLNFNDITPMEEALIHGLPINIKKGLDDVMCHASHNALSKFYGMLCGDVGQDALGGRLKSMVGAARRALKDKVYTKKEEGLFLQDMCVGRDLSALVQYVREMENKALNPYAKCSCGLEDDFRAMCCEGVDDFICVLKSIYTFTHEQDKRVLAAHFDEKYASRSDLHVVLLSPSRFLISRVMRSGRAVFFVPSKEHIKHFTLADRNNMIMGMQQTIAFLGGGVWDDVKHIPELLSSCLLRKMRMTTRERFVGDLAYIEEGRDFGERKAFGVLIKKLEPYLLQKSSRVQGFFEIKWGVDLSGFKKYIAQQSGDYRLAEFILLDLYQREKMKPGSYQGLVSLIDSLKKGEEQQKKYVALEQYLPEDMRQSTVDDVVIYDKCLPYIEEIYLRIKGLHVLKSNHNMSVVDQYKKLKAHADVPPYLWSDVDVHRELLRWTYDILRSEWDSIGLYFLVGAVLFWREVSTERVFGETANNCLEVFLYRELVKRAFPTNILSAKEQAWLKEGYAPITALSSIKAPFDHVRYGHSMDGSLVQFYIYRILLKIYATRT